MRILLDTQCWLWWIAAPEKLNQSAHRRIADKRNTVYLSAASSWEIAIKYSIGKLPLPEPPMQFIPKRLARDAITALPIEIMHTLYVANLPRHHDLKKDITPKSDILFLFVKLETWFAHFW